MDTETIYRLFDTAERALLGAAAGIVTAVGSFLLTGVNHIGYDTDSRIQFGMLAGSLVTISALLLALPFGGINSIAGFLILWAIECLLLAGTNGGFGWTHMITGLILGGAIGSLTQVSYAFFSKEDRNIWLIALTGSAVCLWKVYRLWSYNLWATDQTKAGTMIAQIYAPVPDSLIFGAVAVLFIAVPLWIRHKAACR